MRQDRGFTLIEVMVALLIFGLVSAGVAPVFVDFLKHNTASVRKTEAIEAAQIRLEELRQMNIDAIPTTGTVGPNNITVNGKTYAVYTTYCANSTYCVSANNRHLTVEVFYNSESLFTAETVYTKLK